MKRTEKIEVRVSQEEKTLADWYEVLLTNICPLMRRRRKDGYLSGN